MAPRPRVHPPNYSHVDFRQRLDAALAGAGTVRFRVDRPAGYAATGTAVIGDEPARRLRTTSTHSGPNGYVELGPTLCVSDSVMNKLTQSGLLSPLPSDLPWNCVTGESRYLSMMRSVVDGYDPLHVLAGLDPWLGFESLGLERVAGEELRHLRVASAAPFGVAAGSADNELWIDRYGLPRRLVWTLESGSTAEAVFDGWGDPADVALPPADSQAHDDPGTRAGPR